LRNRYSRFPCGGIGIELGHCGDVRIAGVEDERQFERIWNRGDEQAKQEPPNPSHSEPDLLGIWDAGEDD
jgi:hypothetical protein